MPDLSTLWEWIRPFFAALVLITFMLLSAIFFVWLERKVSARIQNRWGPTRVGPFGLLQPLADGVKFIFKEDLTQPHVYKPLYIAAPIIAVVFAIGLGTISFHLIEGWSILDSLYVTVQTVTTVGFGDVTPKSIQGRIFATVFMLVGVGVVLYALTSTVQSIVQSELVAARNRPQTSVFNRRVFKCKPQSRDLCRFSVEKRAVLMTSDLAADIRLFEDVHRLQ